ncbi:hypothetical protein MXB_3771, partial [Myxobolus squamalis]
MPFSLSYELHNILFDKESCIDYLIEKMYFIFKGSTRYETFRHYSTDTVRCLDILKRPSIRKPVLDRTGFSGNQSY